MRVMQALRTLSLRHCEATLFTIDFELGPDLYSPVDGLTNAKKFWPKINSICLAQGKRFFH